eukprot:CAMPEP_0172332020 /NCGR_PEP_ID=MMETSP1058-20130122/62224_1 /TAXON_ID=83371 /ORGANISM="Detonula confervacea, Strain CCMP 353" /LENGTH=661 /DNA_ID=CAMNT_0013049297 /DNA_START=36 /DNA_END=2018 /DNA_ORIENTATION=+
MRKNGEKPKANEQLAKHSFRVRRSNLMSISGRGNKNRQKHQGKKHSVRQGPQHRDGSSNGKYWLNCDEFVSALKQFIAHVMSSISFGYFQSNIDVPSKERTFSSLIKPRSQNSMENYYDDATVVGLDCEMVGGGKGGWKSLLARCSVVTLDCIPTETTCTQKENVLPNENDATSKQTQMQEQKLTSLEQNLIVLYDKYVIPRGRITDYRTEWSGITKDTYRESNDSHIPIVSFNQCQNEVSQLFSSIGGKRVIVVGHALENDFDALEIEHPPSLIRDTAFYPPYMRRVRKKMYPRKLSTLSSEELDIEIQQKSQTSPSSEEVNTGKSIKNASMVGHSSVEDAAAALRLYWHKVSKWERFLGYPMLKTQQSAQCWAPLKIYLDGCNLPVGMRGVNFKELMGDPIQSNEEKVTMIPSKTFRLTSRNRDSNHPSNISTIDWIPVFQSALLPQSVPRIESISVMFDGAKFSNIKKNGSSRKAQGSLDTRVFCLDSNSTSEKEAHGSIKIEITENGDEADDVLFHRCCTADRTSDSTRKMISLEKVIDILSGDNDAETDVLPNYIVIRRKAGGTKTHRKLFDKLHLRRPNEGAHCLSALTAGLQKDSLRTARELQRERSIERVIECELMSRDELRCVVVTDDVFLTDRLVRNGVLVLGFRQMTNMW